MTQTSFRSLMMLFIAFGLATPAAAQGTTEPGAESASKPAAGLEVWASTDADDTEVMKVLARALWNFEGRDRFQGIAVEKVWFTPMGQQTREDERIYLDLADAVDGEWLWRARIGTDGETVLGSASIRAEDWSQTYFVEREIVETPRGLDEGIYYTFLGATFDFPVDDRNVFTTMLGVQEFTGDNERLHVRGSYIHVVKPEWGLSAQLRGRYYRSTTPHEFDYFSPRNYVEVLPVLQIRRFNSAGWMYQVAAGYGGQHATGSEWQDARFGEIRVESPARSDKLNAFVQLQYSNTSVTGGLDYDHLMGRLGVTAGF